MEYSLTTFSLQPGVREGHTLTTQVSAAEHLSLFCFGATAFVNHWARDTRTHSRSAQSEAQKYTCSLQTCDLRPGAAESRTAVTRMGAHGGVWERVAKAKQGTRTASRSPQTPRWDARFTSPSHCSQTKASLPPGDTCQGLETSLAVMSWGRGGY